MASLSAEFCEDRREEKSENWERKDSRAESLGFCAPVGEAVPGEKRTEDQEGSFSVVGVGGAEGAGSTAAVIFLFRLVESSVCIAVRLRELGSRAGSGLVFSFAMMAPSSSLSEEGGGLIRRRRSRKFLAAEKASSTILEREEGVVGVVGGWGGKKESEGKRSKKNKHRESIERLRVLTV